MDKSLVSHCVLSFAHFICFLCRVLCKHLLFCFLSSSRLAYGD
uniref:Uncharacterized protein n=1 Tax=Anguilla anguilla TaxID=7936 RepID=A0A0E9RKT3_ANGAN